MQFKREPGRICRLYGGISGEQNCKVELWSLGARADETAYNVQRSLRNT